MLKTLIKTPKPKTYSTNTRSDQTHITPILHTLLSSLIKQKNQHTDQTLTTYQQTPSISFRVSNGGEEKLKKKKGGNARFLTIGLRAVPFSLWAAEIAHISRQSGWSAPWRLWSWPVGASLGSVVLLGHQWRWSRLNAAAVSLIRRQADNFEREEDTGERERERESGK